MTRIPPFAAIASFDIHSALDAGPTRASPAGAHAFPPLGLPASTSLEISLLCPWRDAEDMEGALIAALCVLSDRAALR